MQSFIITHCICSKNYKRLQILLFNKALFVFFCNILPQMSWNHFKQTSQIYTFSVFEKIPRVPRQSRRTYSGKVAKMKKGNLYRDVVIRRLINRDLKNYYAFKSKEIMNSSNYILVTYLSDKESKLIPFHCFRVLANLSF